MGQIYEEENGAFSAQFFNECREDVLEEKMRAFEKQKASFAAELIAEATGFSQADVIADFKARLKKMQGSADE